MNLDISMVSRAIAADRGSRMATVAFVTSPLRFRRVGNDDDTDGDEDDTWPLEEVESSRELVDPND